LNTAFDGSDNADSELSYSIVGNTNIGLFSAAGIDGNGQLTLNYAANMNGSAQISVRATDPSGQSVDTLFTVTVTPVNDDPVVQANSGTLASANGPTPISSSELNTTDIDNPNTEVVYTVTALPVNGVLLLNGVEMQVNDSFTQADLDNNRMAYQANGQAVADEFGLTVSDVRGGTAGNRTFVIAVQILPVSAESETTVTEAPLTTEQPSEAEPPAPNPTESGVSGVTQGAGSFGGGFVPFGSTSAPPKPAPTLALEPSVPTVAETLKQVATLEDIDIVPEEEEAYELSTFAAVQMKSMDALWTSVDKMKQEMAESAEQMDIAELKVAAAKSSGVVLTAGIVAWAMRGGALLSSLMSTIPLWKGYDPLPILAYEDDDEEDAKEKDLDEDSIPTSLEELKRLKELKAKAVNIERMFGDTVIRE